MSDLTSRLRQASFRGVPFAVMSGDRTGGRRVKVHELPDRDDPFVEDLGGAARKLTLRGFIIENSLVYGGGDVLDQCARLEAASRVSGAGLLVHPTRGPLTVFCQALTVGDREEQGWFEIAFEFVEAGPSGALAIALSTATAVLGAAASALGVLDQLFGTDADGYVTSGNAPGDTASIASLFSSSALSLGSGAAGVFSLSSSAASASAALATASGGFLSASGGLGLAIGAGASTATTATGLLRSVTSLSDPGSAMDSMGDLADAFGAGFG